MRWMAFSFFLNALDVYIRVKPSDHGAYPQITALGNYSSGPQEGRTKVFAISCTLAILTKQEGVLQAGSRKG